MKWYQNQGHALGEHEARTFLVVPLLQALGWSEQKIKIEWDHIDVALFAKPYTKATADAHPVFIIETKRYQESVSAAKKQGMKYMKRYKDCRWLLLTDGCRYRLYERHGTRYCRIAYLNLLKPRLKHPYDEREGGALELLGTLLAT